MLIQKKHWLLGIIVIVLVAAGSTFAFKRHDIERSLERAALPSPVEYQAAQASVTATPRPTTKPSATSSTPAPAITSQVNLAVPFTVQAPYANWDDPYGEFCEEASVLMAMSYIKGEKIPTADVANTKLLAIKAFEEKRFGFYKDTTAAQTATIIQEMYGYKNTKLIDNPTAADIKQALSEGKLVLTPLAGRMLGNPYYQTPGPLYHMLVVKGYTKDGKFITNDPGTRHGADFLYSEKTIMDAIHDWHNDEHIELGKKVILVVG